MNVVIATQPLKITRQSMNRGHLYLEVWYWMLDLIEREQDDERRSSMNTVQIAFAEGVDTDKSNQYRAGCKALQFAKELGESVFASNIETLLADYMYIDVQDNPASVAHKLDLDPQAEARETERDLVMFGPAQHTVSNLEPMNNAELRQAANWESIPFPTDMPIIDLDNIDEIPF